MDTVMLLRQAAIKQDAELLTACLANIIDANRAEAVLESAVVMMRMLITEAMLPEGLLLASELRKMLQCTSSQLFYRVCRDLAKEARLTGDRFRLEGDEDKAQSVYVLAECFLGAIMSHYESRQERNEEVIVPPEYNEARQEDQLLSFAQGGVAVYFEQYLSGVSPPPIDTPN